MLLVISSGGNQMRVYRRCQVYGTDEQNSTHLQNETFESKFSYECGIRIIILLTHISVPYVTSIFKCWHLLVQIACKFWSLMSYSRRASASRGGQLRRSFSSSSSVLCSFSVLIQYGRWTHESYCERRWKHYTSTGGSLMYYCRTKSMKLIAGDKADMKSLWDAFLTDPTPTWRLVQ